MKLIYELYDEITKKSLLGKKFYHGTQLEIVEPIAIDSYLFIVDEIEVAKQHGEDRAESAIRNFGKLKATAVVYEITIDNDILNMDWDVDDDLGWWNYKTWQESYEKAGSLVLYGDIDLSKFKIVYYKEYRASKK